MKALVVCKHQNNSKEAEICRLINKPDLNIKNTWKNTLKKEDFKDIDFAIAIGGDGTVLSASHYLQDKPLLAVNSSPRTSEGALTSISIEQLDKKIDEIIKGKNKEEIRERIEAFINNKIIDSLALNEIFIGNPIPYLPSKYILKFKDKEEFQISSGLLFATGTGSTAWFKSASGIPFKPSEKFIKMLVREPYEGKIYKPKIKSTEIRKNEEVKIIAKTNLILVIDSIREFKLNENDEVKIKISPFPLRMII